MSGKATIKISLANVAKTADAARVLLRPDFAQDFSPVWSRLAPVVASEMAGRIHSRGIIRTGRLLGLIERDPVRRLNEYQLRVGPSERYQFVQHYGSAKRGIEPRPFVEWTSRGRKAFRSFMQEHLLRGTREMQGRMDREAR